MTNKIEFDFGFCLAHVSWKVKPGDKIWFRMTIDNGVKEYFISKDDEDWEKSPDGINWEKVKII